MQVELNQCVTEPIELEQWFANCVPSEAYQEKLNEKNKNGIYTVQSSLKTYNNALP